MLTQFLMAAFRRRMKRIGSRGADFAADGRGVAAVEFALISIPFFMILCAIFETAFLVFNQGNLEHATYEASRQLLTGSIQSSGANSTTQAANFKTAVCSRLWANFNCNNVRVDVQSAAAFGGQNTSSDFFSTSYTPTFSGGASGNVVVVRVGYPYPLYFNRFSGFGGSTANIMAVTVFKAENY